MFYCKAKQSIEFLKPSNDIDKERYGIAINEFSPREVFYSFKDENVEDEIGLKEYCATFLFALFLEKHKAFPNQSHSLITDDTLKYSEILASISPFYNTSTQLLHMGGKLEWELLGDEIRNFCKTIRLTIN